MLFHIGTLTVNDAACIIVDMVKLPSFQTTPDSK
jgi:hypothetical protein